MVDSLVRIEIENWKECVISFFIALNIVQSVEAAPVPLSLFIAFIDIVV